MSGRPAPLVLRDLPPVIPVFPLTGVLLLPRGRLPLNIFEPRYLAMVRDALAAERLIGMIQPRNPEPTALPALYPVGCLGRISAFSETDDGRFLVTLSGVCRFRVTAELGLATPYRQVAPHFDSFAADLDPEAVDEAFDRPALTAALRAYLDLHGMSADWHAVDQAGAEALVNTLAMTCPFDPAEKQALLEAPTIAARAETMIALIRMAVAANAVPPERSLQ